jgi:hypothetical protein
MKKGHDIIIMKQYYTLFLSGLIYLSVLFSGCNLYNPAEPVPSYIHIEKISVTTTSEQGSNSSNITDAWIYIDEKLIGCFELPATIPVLYEGTHQVSIKAGIKINGIAATRGPYPFYERFTQSVSLTRGSITDISPAVTYTDDLNWDPTVIWQENFENSGGITIDPSPTPHDTNLVQYTIPPGTDPSLVFEGTGSGLVYVTPDKPLFECISSTSYFLPRGDSPVFLELNYKCNYTFVIGLFAHSSNGTVKNKVLNINSSTDWKKIYIYLSPVIASSGNASDFSIFLGMLNNTNTSGAYLAIDNIKVVHY